MRSGNSFLVLAMAVVPSLGFAQSGVTSQQLSAFKAFASQLVCKGPTAETQQVADQVGAIFDEALSKIGQEDAALMGRIAAVEKSFNRTLWATPRKIRGGTAFEDFRTLCGQRIGMAYSYVAPKKFPDGRVTGTAYNYAASTADWTGGMADLESIFAGKRERLVPAFVLGYANLMIVLRTRSNPDTGWGKGQRRSAVESIKEALSLAHQSRAQAEEISKLAIELAGI